MPLGWLCPPGIAETILYDVKNGRGEIKIKLLKKMILLLTILDVKKRLPVITGDIISRIRRLNS
jgi:hypothetical protein